jgi:hypothetical protein
MRTSKILAIALFAASSVNGLQTAVAQVTTNLEPSAAVKTCITKNAPDVERAMESLTEGVDFLTGKICASEIADQALAWSDEKAKEQAAAYRASAKKMCEAQAQAAGASDTADRRVSYLDAMCTDPEGDIMGLDMNGGMSFGYYLNQANLPKASALAAQTLLQLRLKRLAAKE